VIELIVGLLKPLFVPLLKLKLEPPHLPEGTELVRHLKPSESWLTYRYLQALFGLLGQVVGAGVLVVVLVTQGHEWGAAGAVAVALVEAVIVGFALVTVRVDYELRHYLVGDRSLRVSFGAFTRKEVTLSYANVQNLEVSQGPLERVFGFKGLMVTTAGGDAAVPGQQGESLHQVHLVGLTNAEEVRALILGMLQQHKDSGLGEVTRHEAGVNVAMLVEIRDAARALAEAARG
jgi:membrane protein YdbS with pleckstrin-like domain